MSYNAQSFMPRAGGKSHDVTERKRQRKNSWEYEEDDGDGEFEGHDSDSDSEEKAAPQKKRGRPRKSQAEKLVARKKTKLLNTIRPVPQDNEEERFLLEEKHRSRMQQYEQDSKQLLEEVRDLAMQEKKVQDKLIEKLKKDITILSKEADEERKKRKTEVDRIVADKIREIEDRQKNKDDGDAEKALLRERIKELESQFASFKRSTGPDDVVNVNAAAVSAASTIQNSNVTIQLDQANKLLEVYRLVTSTDIRLIQSCDDDEQDGDDCTEVVCTTTDSATGNQLEFELAIPVVVANEIEYLPSDKPPMGIEVPSYLRKELSFSRSEMTKFIRTVLDVVIRKRKV